MPSKPSRTSSRTLGAITFISLWNARNSDTRSRRMYPKESPNLCQVCFSNFADHPIAKGFKIYLHERIEGLNKIMVTESKPEKVHPPLSERAFQIARPTPFLLDLHSIEAHLAIRRRDHSRFKNLMIVMFRCPVYHFRI